MVQESAWQSFFRRYTLGVPAAGMSANSAMVRH